MKAILFALLGLAVCTEARRLTVANLTAADKETAHNLARTLGRKLRTARLGSATECNLCVTFMDDSLNDLLQIILNGGVIGSCAALCGMLPNSLEQQVCNLMCDVVGVEGFVKLVQDADLDPIWMCEEITLCQKTTCTANCAAFKQLSPGASTTFPTGSTIQWQSAFAISAGVGASTLLMTMSSLAPDSNGDYHSGAVEAFLPQPTPGFFQATLPVTLADTDANGNPVPWPPGQYNATAIFCDGMCGSHHTGSGKVLASINGPTITVQ